MSHPPLILASQSTTRKALLEKLGIPFTVQPAHVDETPLKHEAPLAYVKRIALAKAQAVSTQNPGSVVLAADTPVIVGRRILQKPESYEEALTMLKLHSGRRISIPTVVVVVDATGKSHHKVSVSWVKFKRFSQAEIEVFLAATKWREFSGSIHIELMEPWLQTTHGSISGIMGLPLYETTRLLARAGLTPKPFKIA